MITALLLLSLMMPVDPGEVIVIRRGAGGGGGPTCTQEATDTFATDTRSNYTQTCAGPCGGQEWTVGSGVLSNSGSDGEDMQMTNDTALTDSARQWACHDLANTIEDDPTGMVLRFGTATTDPYYMGSYLQRNPRILFRVCQSDDNTEPNCTNVTVQYCDEDGGDCSGGFACPVAGDTVCWEIDGTGTATTMRYWLNPTGGSTPDDWGTEDAKLFGDGSTAPTCPSGWTASAAGDGSGLCANDITTNCTIDGDCPASTCEFPDTGLKWGTYGEDNGVGDQDNFAVGSCDG